MDTLNLSEDELLRELLALTQHGHDGMSREELAERTGRSEEWVRRQLKRYQRRGALIVGYRPAKDLIGRASRTPVYRLKGGDECSP